MHLATPPTPAVPRARAAGHVERQSVLTVPAEDGPVLRPVLAQWQRELSALPGARARRGCRCGGAVGAGPPHAGQGQHVLPVGGGVQVGVRVGCGVPGSGPAARGAGAGGSCGAAAASTSSAGDQAEVLVGDEAAHQRPDERASAAAAADRAEHPERDLVEDVHQRAGDEQVDQAVAGRTEQGEPGRGEEHPHRGDQGEALHDLDGQAPAERLPPPVGGVLGLGQCVEHQRDRGARDEDDGQRDADDERQSDAGAGSRGVPKTIVNRTRSPVPTRIRWPCSTNLREPRHLPVKVTPRPTRVSRLAETSSSAAIGALSRAPSTRSLDTQLRQLRRTREVSQLPRQRRPDPTRGARRSRGRA